MILTVFYNLIKALFDPNEIDIRDSEYYPFQSNTVNYSSTLKAPFDEEGFKYSTGLFSIRDKHNRENIPSISGEIIETLKININDFVIYQDKIFFKNKEDKEKFETKGYEIYSEALSACFFDNLEKKQMGKISFINENNYYVRIRPKKNKESELLKEITLFFKDHGYSVDHEYFQTNFYVYENNCIKVFVKDSAMAAELCFSITTKELASVLDNE